VEDWSDDNRDAAVAVAYRKKSGAQWKDAQPLLRIGDEQICRAPMVAPSAQSLE